jgi:hypothetical protein
MKNLFTVYKTHFDNKLKAKEHRDQTGQPLRQGPDHIGPHGKTKKSWHPDRCGIMRNGQV